MGNFSYLTKLKSDVDSSGSIYNFNFKDIEANKNGKSFNKALKSNATIPMYLTLFLVVVACSIGCYFVKENVPQIQNIEIPLKEISSKQDSIYGSINRLTQKYKPTQPVKVNTKSFNRSSFFQANNVDSVQVKVFNK